MNDTMTTFGYPESCVREYTHWAVLLRPKQVTLGSLILVCKDEARAFGDITPGAFVELATAVADLERTLKSAFDYDKINYLMLMMVDPDVHFHVIPRHEGVPLMPHAREMEKPEVLAEHAEKIRAAFKS